MGWFVFAYVYQLDLVMSWILFQMISFFRFSQSNVNINNETRCQDTNWFGDSLFDQ